MGVCGGGGGGVSKTIGVTRCHYYTGFFFTCEQMASLGKIYHIISSCIRSAVEPSMSVERTMQVQENLIFPPDWCPAYRLPLGAGRATGVRFVLGGIAPGTTVAPLCGINTHMRK